ncbi:MAG: type I-MYXAN CRISPR-associated endonuclease Cas1 [Deltaproteobacteria bacterium]|nr:type I-MYXAN CRISPR-associated endonuclease Cas1 [Deltaproteobacteria bacterium]
MDDSLVNVMALHALAYCERLFFLEEVERIRIADAAVYAGRRVHEELPRPADDEGSWDRRTLESETLGLRGVVDVLKRRDGRLVPWEHKRGRSAGRAGAREAWRTDRIQVAAYAMLIEEATADPVAEARVRYHADGVTVPVAVDDALRTEVRATLARARELRSTVERPPVPDNEKLCVRCALAPVCLPEESRAARDPSFRPIRLFPPHQDRKTLHVTESGAKVGRASAELVLRSREGGREDRFPITEVGQVVLHGFAQISTQALRLCADNDVGVSWVTGSGRVLGTLAPPAAAAQRHLRQFRALSDAEMRLALARRLVAAKVESQLRFLLRATRDSPRSPELAGRLESMRAMLRRISRVTAPDELLGVEGNAAAAYFESWPDLLIAGLDPRLRMCGRSRRPPKDQVNALLGYGYGMLYREVLAAVLAVGLHPGVGFYHRPRSAAHTLVLDLMELFRVPLVDMAVVAALNRRTFDPDADFDSVPGQVLLSESGRRKAIEVLERRRADVWRHPAVNYSLSWARMAELECRLLEKEWMGEGNLFARFRLR